MNKILLLVLVLTSAVNGFAASSVANLDSANNRLNDVESLRRGAKLFVQRCSSCHSVKYLRYSEIGKHLGWSFEEIDQQMLVSGRAKEYDVMLGGLDEAAAISIYGKPVPDLSLTAKVRSPDWIYNYLRAYYVDESGKTDNYLMPGVSMPNILIGDQGIMKPIYADLNGRRVVVDNEPAQIPASYADQRSQDRKLVEFDLMVRDLTNFLEFASEPNKLERYALGVKVIAFLLVLLVIFYLLKKEYWRDIK